MSADVAIEDDALLPTETIDGVSGSMLSGRTRMDSADAECAAARSRTVAIRSMGRSGNSTSVHFAGCALTTS
jgi:hypothetical protein